MRKVTITISILLSSAFAFAGDTEVRLATRLAVERTRPSKDTSPTDPNAHAVPFLTDYVKAGNLAVKEGKPLMVWVAYKCPSSANQLPGAVHVFLDSFQGDKTQRVVVGVPDGKDWLNLAGTVQAEDCCASALTKVAEGGAMKATVKEHAPAQTWSTPMRPMQMQMGGWSGTGGGMMAPSRFQLRGGRGGACAT